jgi:hypothetical protein
MRIGSSWPILTFTNTLKNQNREGDNILDIATFNEVIMYLGTIELPMKFRAFKWRTMEIDPLLE